MTQPQIAIRDIQHFMYCPHRWGLMKIDCAWAENYFVSKANVMHGRVHDPEKSYTLRGKKVFTSLPVYCDLPEYGLTGNVDCIECTSVEHGGVRSMDATGRQYALCIVEYKPTLPKGRDYNEDDAMQVFAQKVCVDSIFGCDCDAALYYADAKKRVLLPFKVQKEQWDERLRNVLAQMRTYLEQNRVPPIVDGQNCGGCSMKDMCMPTLKRRFTVRARVARAMEDTTCESY